MLEFIKNKLNFRGSGHKPLVTSFSAGAKARTTDTGTVSENRRVVSLRSNSTPQRPIGRFPFSIFNRARYSVVSGDEAKLREAFAPETGSEEKALSTSERNSMIAFARHLVRNTEDMGAITTQFDNNVIGVCAGKATFNFPPEYKSSAQKMREAFAEWATSCEFFSGGSFQFILEQVLFAKLVTGRVVLLFDEGLVKDSGKIIVFDGDAIGNLPSSDFEELYSKHYTQHQGLVKNEFGQNCGVIVSMSQRGKGTFSLRDAEGRIAVFALNKDADTPWLDSPFMMYAHNWRINQTAFAPATHASLASVYDINQIIGFEKEATKKNAQTIGTITSQSPDLPPPSDNEGDYVDEVASVDGEAGEGGENGGNGENGTATGAEATGADYDDLLPPLQFDREKNVGVLFDVLPQDAKLELLDTKHPNVNTTQFIAALQRRVGWANGLGAVYANGKADSSYSASLVEMRLSWPKFEKEQHRLEAQICDWVIRRWYAWAVRKGKIPADLKLPPNWKRCIEWAWPRKPAINPVDEESAFSSGIRNGTVTFKDRFGPDWERIIEQRAREREAFRAAGLNFPGDLDNNGMVQPQAEDPDTIDNNNNKKDKQ